MMAPTHQLFGTTFGLVAFLLLQLFGVVPNSVLETCVYFFITLLGSILPDLDHPKSKLGSKFPFIFLSIPLYLIFGHRGITHSFFFAGIVGIFSFSLVPIFSLSPFYALGLTLGVLSHIIGDFMFEGGVPLLYPSKKRYRPLLTFKVDGMFEAFFSMGLLVINGLLIISLLKEEIFR